MMVLVGALRTIPVTTIMTDIIREECEDLPCIGEESDSSIYTPSKPHTISTSEPTPSHLTGREREASEDVLGFAGGRSQTAVITSSRFGKEKLSKKGMRRRAAGGPASNTLFDENRHGWTEADLPRQDWCMNGRREKEVESRSPHQMPSQAWSLHCFLTACKNYAPFSRSLLLSWTDQLKFSLRASELMRQ